MPRTICALGALTLVATLLPAQTGVVPNVPEGNSATSYPWNRTTTGIRIQYIYDTTTFTDQGITTPIVMNSLKWRINGTSTCLGGTYTGVNIDVSTAAVDYLTPNTTFAANHGVDLTTVYTGTVTLQAVPTAGTPGVFFVDVPLATPFTYDPAAGDFIVDILIPTGSWAGAGTASTDYHFGVGVAGTRVYNLDPAGTTVTGTNLEAIAVMGFDYTLLPGYAQANGYGTGCGASLPGSFYEIFDSNNLFDLQNAGVTINPVTGGYVVSPGAGTWFAPTSTPLVILDDDILQQTLTFPFPYAGTLTNDIWMCSNGWVSLESTTSTDYSETVAELLTGPARVFPMWDDLNPSTSGGGAVHFDVDPSGTAAYATWIGVPEYSATGANDFQVKFDVSGTIEIRYGAATIADCLVGFSLGNGAPDPGGVDISAITALQLGDDRGPLSLRPVNRPVIGSTFNMEVGNIPAGTPLGAELLSFVQHDPGLSLAGMGMAGCFQHVNLDSTVLFFPTGATETLSQTIPNWSFLAGMNVYIQTATFSPGFTNLGVISSDALNLLLDIN